MRLDERAVVATVERLSVRRLRTWVRRGWIRPVEDRGAAVFTDIDLARIRLVCQLREDLNVNDEAVPVVLSLLDQVYGLRQELRCLARAVETQPGQVRDAVAEAARTLRDRDR